MRRIALALALAFLAALAACASSEKRGDRAAATGDWKSAEAQYAAAVRDDPANAEKRAKWQQARQMAIQGAVAAARACQVSQDWECVFGETDYLVRLEPGNAEFAAMRADAGRNAAALRLRRASEAGQRRDHRAAFALLAQAKAATNDPGIHAEAARIAPAIVKGAVDDAMQLRAQQQYPQSIELLTLAVNVDGRVRPTLEQVRGEYDRWLDAQYEAAAQQGDALLRERRFAEAQAQYEAALRFKKGGRAEPLAVYARSLAQGDAAVQRRDWAAAAGAYDQAVKTGMDAGGYAAAQLERVRPRPMAIRVRTAVVKPFRDDGSPWSGSRGRGFDRLMGRLASRAFDRANRADADAVRDALELYDILPLENHPNLYATLTLPDGREYATPPQRGIKARFESIVVMVTNAYDDRPVAIRVLHASPAGPVEVGAVTVRMTDLMAGGEVSVKDRALLQLRIVAEASPLGDGAAQGFALVPPPQAQPVPASAPVPVRPAPRR
jgi:tetratricopeptide (TPR) repeat protein